MSTTSLTSSTKYCACCQFWKGPRKAGSSGKDVCCGSSGVEGVCQNPKSSLRNKSTKADYLSCHNFQKWDKLK